MNCCIKCGGEIQQGFNCCPYCSEPIGHSGFKMNNNNFGNENINIGGSDYAQQRIYINKYAENNNEIEYAEDLDMIVRGGVDGYKKRVEIAGVISLISAVITIWQFLDRPSMLLPLFLITTVCTAWYSTQSWYKYKGLKQYGRFKREGKIELIIEDDDVCTVRKYGNCKICGGRVYIDKYPDSKTKRRFGRCVNNSDHLYTFDPTVNRGELIKRNYLE